MSKVIVTGGCGFIGSNLLKVLVENGDEVVCLDNLSTGTKKFLEGEIQSQIRFIEADLVLQTHEDLIKSAKGADKIYHLAANADVRDGWMNPTRDLTQNAYATLKIAEIAREAKVEEVVFTSTGCVYGDSVVIPTPEEHPFPTQTSLYGSSKVAGEGILSSYVAQGVFKATVFRFVSVLGQNYHHGHVFDFVRKLKLNSKELEILGNGKQKKSYIHVDDCVRALVSLRGVEPFEVFNIGARQFIEVIESAKIICDHMGISPMIKTGDQNRGWVGDNPFTYLDITKAESYGWSPRVNIKDSIIETVEWLMLNEWVFSKSENRYIG
jgi:UDP-glucose 4-epimerase